MSTQRTKITVTTPDLVSFPKAAKELGIAPSTLYRMRDRGEFTPFRIGTQVFITATDLNRLRKERQKQN